MTETVRGPASYFPSIEKTYGQLMSHGHANAIVVYQLAARKGAKR